MEAILTSELSLLDSSLPVNAGLFRKLASLIQSLPVAFISRSKVTIRR